MKKKRTKSTRAAWKEIREAFQAYADGGARHTLALDGLCIAICIIDGISCEQHFEMICAIKTRKPDLAYDGVYFWPLTRAGARHRVKLIDKILKSL